MNTDIKKFIEELKTLDTYRVFLDSDDLIDSERHVDGEWVSAYSLQCLIEDFEKVLTRSSDLV